MSAARAAPTESAEEPLTPARPETRPETHPVSQPAARSAKRPASDAPPAQPIDGLPVDALTLAGAAQQVVALLAQGQERGQAAQVVTLNPELVMRARRDAGLAQVIRVAALVTADGMGIVWGLRLAGRRLPARVTGVDLALALAEQAAASGEALFLLGAGPGVARAAADALQRHFVGLRIAGCWGGAPCPQADAEATAHIRASGARLLLVAYGAPAQELWIARNLAALPGVVAIGIGGALDMLAGRTPRAPRWLRAAGLEWLYRLARQPWRWRRMLALPRFALLALLAGASVWRARLTHAPDAGILTMRAPHGPVEAPGAPEAIPETTN